MTAPDGNATVCGLSRPRIATQANQIGQGRGVKLFSYRKRPVHLGPFALERLARAPPAGGGPRPQRPRAPAPAAAEGEATCLAEAALTYQRLFEQFRDGELASARAPVPEDPVRLAQDLKAAAYYLDASMVGACAIPAAAWYATGDDGKTLAPYHRHALVILVEHARAPEADNLANDWVAGAQEARAAMRGVEIAVILAGYIRRLGWPARAHSRDLTDVDHGLLVVHAGLGERRQARIVNPFVGEAFGTAVATTDMPLAADMPLAPDQTPGRPPGSALAARRRAISAGSPGAGRATSRAFPWSASSGWTISPPWCSRTRCRGCRSAPVSSSAHSRATWARRCGVSARASPASNPSPTPWCP